MKSKPLLLETMGEGGQLNGGVPTLEVNDSKIPTLEVNDSTIPTLEVNKNQSTETSGNEGVFESSTTVLLRRPTAESEGGRRVPSFHLASRTDFTLSDTFRVSGKLCVVTLEEDHISWVPKKTTGKKEGIHCTNSLYCFPLLAVSHTPRTRGSHSCALCRSVL